MIVRYFMNVTTQVVKAHTKSSDFSRPFSFRPFSAVLFPRDGETKAHQAFLMIAPSMPFLPSLPFDSFLFRVVSEFLI